MEKKTIKFKTLRSYISRLAPLSICSYETMQYDNYLQITDVPAEYDELFVYGIGLVKDMFVEGDVTGYMAKWECESGGLLDCMEIVQSKQPRTDI